MYDIIMNSVALEVVMSCDEAIFSALVPDIMHQMIPKMKPLEVKKGPIAALVLPLFRVFFVIGVMLFAGLAYFVPMYDIMDQVRYEMCSGQQNFVVRQDLSKQYTLWLGHTKPTELQADSLGDTFDLYRHDATLQATALECQKARMNNGGNLEYPGCPDEKRQKMPKSLSDAEVKRYMTAGEEIPGQLYAVDASTAKVSTKVGVWQNLITLGIIDRANEAYCFDFDTHPWTADTEKGSIRSALAEQLERDIPWVKHPTNGFEGACAALADLCGDVAHWKSTVNWGNLVRHSCPLTCGCNDPQKGQFHGHHMYGCPSVCAYPYDNALKASACVDVPDGHAGLAEYQTGYQNLLYYDSIISAKKEAGELIPVSCSSWNESAGLLRWSNWSIGPISACDTSTADIFWVYGVRSTRALCPVTCGCKEAPNTIECPASCR
jgi:hypothetical protein